ncbi:hypothetical protein A1O7_07187 [Cladophialophora yegresii CBS 114405]|uniref:Uncharacterized protein n=1 Tax=Cladophialophora yegresii CBS 114405 TaxID=1182544 RepID=W9VMU9_9EURO|nr:uncharacterized protein A1O7_07187 [Cladophialophora yegresii CBS 114405]EXJ56843.1 hypothetical protein A1O7_07187 [Cladophialophora yegresii CBS 114405]
MATDGRALRGVGRTVSKSNQSDSLPRPLTDEESRSATQANEKRTAILHAQNNHLKRLASAKGAINDRQAGHIHRLSQKHAAELQHVKFVNDQISESLRADLRDEAERLAKEVKSVPAAASELIKADDRALAELNELSLCVSVKQEDALEVDELQARVDKLTRALHLFRATAVKDRFDRIYLESLHAADVAAGIRDVHDVSDPAESTAEEELSSLYEEIDDMVTMVVAHDHGNALGVAFQDIRHAQMQETRATNEKALEGLTARVDTLQAQRHDLHELEAQLRLIEADDGPRRNPVTVAARAGSNDTAGTAAHALLQHLNISTHVREMSQITGLDSKLDGLTRTLERQSAQYIAQILHTSEQTVDRRRVALESISEALTTDEKHELAVRALAESIAATRAGIESAQT